jgi:hypothetical protein
VVKKIVISPDNKKALALLEELSKRKLDFQKKLSERLSQLTRISSQKGK